METIDRTFYILDGLKNLGPEYFDLKIKLVHQELQEAKAEAFDLALAATPGYAGENRYARR